MEVASRRPSEIPAGEARDPESHLLALPPRSRAWRRSEGQVVSARDKRGELAQLWWEKEALPRGAAGCQQREGQERRRVPDGPGAPRGLATSARCPGFRSFSQVAGCRLGHSTRLLPQQTVLQSVSPHPDGFRL